MFLSLSDFNARPYRIPNQAESPDLEQFIEEKEEEILQCLFGYELYTEFMANVDTSGAESRWVNLRDGAEYTYDEKLYRYRGLIDMLRPAIYSLWVDQNAYKFTNVGMVNNNAPEKSIVIDAEPHRVKAWNDYVRKAYDRGSRKNTLHGFMEANESDYDSWEFDEYAPCVAYQNRFSL